MTASLHWNITEFIYHASLMLLYPTLLLLALSLLGTMWHLGELAWDRLCTWGRSRRAAAEQLRSVGSTPSGLVRSLHALATSPVQHPRLRRFVAAVLEELGRGESATLPARLAHLAGEAEAALKRDVNRVRALVRLGPCLGLAGTLIPLGPGLLALSEGDLSRLSAHLVVAFSTTVIGLLVGGVSYVVAIARAHTTESVANDIDLIVEVVCEQVVTGANWVDELMQDGQNARTDTPMCQVAVGSTGSKAEAGHKTASTERRRNG